MQKPRLRHLNTACQKVFVRLVLYLSRQRPEETPPPSKFLNFLPQNLFVWFYTLQIAYLIRRITFLNAISLSSMIQKVNAKCCDPSGVKRQPWECFYPSQITRKTRPPLTFILAA